MIAIIAMSATIATAVGVALSQTVQMVETVYQMAEKVSNALNIQNDFNGHIQLGILTLNQQVALVQEQADMRYSWHCIACFCYCYRTQTSYERYLEYCFC